MKAELEEHYASLLEGRPTRLVPLPLRFTDYIVWERAWFLDGAGRHDVERVRARLEGARPLAIADKAPDVPVGAAAIEASFQLDAGASARFAEHCRAAAVTPFIGLSAVVAVHLARWSRQDDVVFVSPVNLLHLRPEMRALFGRRSNVVPIRMSLHGDPTWADLVKRAKQHVTEAFAFEQTPATLALRTADVFSHPLARVIFNMPSSKDAPPSRRSLPAPAGVELKLGPPLARSGARADLAIVAGQNDGRFQLTLRGAADRLEPGTVHAQRDILHELLRNFDPADRPLHGLDLTSCGPK